MNRYLQRGQTLVELTVVTSIMGLLALGGTMAVDNAKRRVALAGATSVLRADFQRVRMLAIAHDRNIAIRFRDEGNGWSWAAYEDGDGDGVRNDDIDKGVDKRVGILNRLQLPARIGVPPGKLPDPFDSQPLSSRPPVRFGASSLCSFSRTGEATNGSVVLTDGKDAVVLQVQGLSARINVHRWRGGKWVSGV